MRTELEQLVLNTFNFEFRLPYPSSNIDKFELSFELEDTCLSSCNDNDVAKVIYNNIVEYAVNEFKLNQSDLGLEQRKILKRNLKYNANAKQPTKIKYGLYGEVLMDSIFKVFFGADTLIAKGYFYDPMAKSEIKGYDSYHLLQVGENVELFFGEAKFYEKYKDAVDSVYESLKKSLDDEYFNTNLIAISDYREKFTNNPSKLTSILDAWELDPDINLAEEMKKNDIQLIYPMFLSFKKGVSYEKIVKNVVDYFNKKIKKDNFKINMSLDVRVFLVLLPVDNVKKIKEDVIKWIELNEPLI